MSKDIFEQALMELSKNRVRKAAIRTLNKAATSVSAFIAKAVREKYKVPSAEVKKALKVSKAKAAGAATLGDLSSSIEISQKGLPLALYGAKPKVVTLDKKVRRTKMTAKGIKKVTVREKRIGVTVNVMGQRKLVKGGFLATVNGKQNIYARKTAKRFPIKLLYGPSIRNMMGEEFMRQVEDFARQRVETLFQQELNYELTKPLTEKSGGNAA